MKNEEGGHPVCTRNKKKDARSFFRRRIPSEDLPDVPKEEGARGTNLYYCVTGLDTWGNSGAKAKEKSTEYYVTPEGWYRNNVMQMPGGVASRVDTP